METETDGQTERPSYLAVMKSLFERRPPRARDVGHGTLGNRGGRWRMIACRLRLCGSGIPPT